MKKITPISVLLTILWFSPQLSAQNTKSPYVPVLTENIKWHIAVLEEFGDYFTYYLSLGDTEVINGKEYTIIQHGEGPGGEAYLREDIAERKIYNIAGSASEEYVMYDFTLDVGDAFEIGLGTYTVDSIGYIDTYDGPRKAWYLSAVTSGDLTPIWVEGIGSLAGILNPEKQPNLNYWDFPELLCFEDDGVMLYKSENGEDYGCQLESLDIEENSIDLLLELYPNPTTGIITLRLPSQYLQEPNAQYIIRISNVLGKEVLSKKSNTLNDLIDLSQLSQGIYLLGITDENQKQLVTKKIIKL